MLTNLFPKLVWPGSPWDTELAGLVLSLSLACTQHVHCICARTCSHARCIEGLPKRQALLRSPPKHWALYGDSPWHVPEGVSYEPAVGAQSG